MRIIFAACGLSLFVTSLVRADEQPATTKVTFEEHVKPILRQHCANCHNQGEKKGGLALDSYAALIEGGGSGEIVYDDGDVEASRLWELVNHDDTPVMPPNQDKLPAEQLAVIRAWIEGGILENSGSKAKANKKNSLAFVASGSGRPEGGGAMPASIPQRTLVVTERPAAITAIAASPWAPLIAIAGQKQIVLYHADTHELLGILPFEEGIAQSLRFSRDGSFLIAGGGEHSVAGLVAIYDIKTGDRVAVVGDELDTVFGADANDTMTRIALGGPQKMLRIFDVADGTLLFDLKKHTDWIFAVAYSPDGVLIATGDRSGGLCVWEAETGRLYLELNEHKGSVHAVAWRDDSNMLASASEDGTVKLWDMVQGKAVKSWNGHGGGVTDVAFDHEGRLVTAGKDNRVKLWDATGNHIRDFEPMTEQVLEVAITHDGKQIVYGDWTGAVLSVSTADPTQKNLLAANPAPLEVRLEAVKQTLVAVQQELEPAQAALDAADQAVTAAQIPIDELSKQIAARQAEAATAKADAELMRTQVEAIDGELPTLTTASRDLHDTVIVTRLGLKSNPHDAAALELVAASEQKMAEHLLLLAQKRRDRVTTAASLQTNMQMLANKTAAAEQLAAMMPPLEKQLDEAKHRAATAKQTHDQVASRLAAVQSKHDQLAAEMK